VWTASLGGVPRAPGLEPLPARDERLRVELQAPHGAGLHDAGQGQQVLRRGRRRRRTGAGRREVRADREGARSRRVAVAVGVRRLGGLLVAGRRRAPLVVGELLILRRPPAGRQQRQSQEPLSKHGNVQQDHRPVERSHDTGTVSQCRHDRSTKPISRGAMLDLCGSGASGIVCTSVGM